MPIDLRLLNAIQRAYHAGVDYEECIRKFNKHVLHGHTDPFDVEYLIVAYSALKAAHVELCAAINGDMRDSKS